MKQMTFADAEYAGKRKQTRKELFLIEMDRVVPWKGLIALIEPHYPKGVRVVEPVDGTPTFADQCRRGAPVMQEMAAARCSRRLETPK